MDVKDGPCYGHSCFSVVAKGKHVLFDPFISGNELAKDVKIDEIKADYIFVSHGQYDHMLDVVTIAKRTGAQVIAGFELYSYFQKQGLTNLFPLNPGGKASFDFGIAKSVIAQHSCSLPDGTYAGVASGCGRGYRGGYFCQGKQGHGVHYDTFGFIKIDKEKAIQAFEKAGMTLRLPAIGETFNY